MNTLVALQVNNGLNTENIKQSGRFNNIPEMLAVQSRYPADDLKCKL